MSRAYLRLDPRAFEKKVIQQGYSLPLFAAFVAVLCEAEHQPTRGRFRSERVLRAVLDDAAGRHIGELIKRGDLVRQPDGTLYVDGWDEWQEGDWKVGERVRRIRERRRDVTVGATVANVTDVTPETVTPDTVGTVYTPSDGGRQSVIDGGKRSGKRSDSPPPPAERGRRADGTNPRATGTSPRQEGENPRATGTSERQEREAAKRAPVIPLQVAEPDDGLSEEEIERGVAEYREKMRAATG